MNQDRIERKSPSCISIVIFITMICIIICSAIITLIAWYPISGYIHLIDCSVYKAEIESRSPKSEWPVIRYYPIFSATYIINNISIDGKGSLAWYTNGFKYEFESRDELHKYIGVSKCFINKYDMKIFAIDHYLRISTYLFYIGVSTMTICISIAFGIAICHARLERQPL